MATLGCECGMCLADGLGDLNVERLSVRRGVQLEGVPPARLGPARAGLALLV